MNGLKFFGLLLCLELGEIAAVCDQDYCAPTLSPDQLAALGIDQDTTSTTSTTTPDPDIHSDSTQNSDFLTTQAPVTIETSTPVISSALSVANEIAANGIPSIDSVPGSAIPVVTMQDLETGCSDIRPNIRAPSNNGDPTLVELSLAFDRFVGIDDLAESLSVMATMFVKWGVTTCRDQLAIEKPDAERVLVARKEDFWHPTILFSSSSDDVGMVSGKWYEDLEVVYQPVGGMDFVIFFYMVKIGPFTTDCPLQLNKFPFDKQTCKLKFRLKQSSDLLQFHSKSRMIAPVLSKNDEWIYVDSWVDIFPSQPNLLSNSSSIEFNLQLQRKPDYLLINIMGPVFALVVLELATILLPPEMPDRPTFYCVILLSLMVSQATILQSIPRTPQRVLLADFNLMLILWSGLLCIYSIVICYKANKKQSTKRYFGRFKLSGVRASDVVAFLVSFLLLLAIIGYVIYSSQM